MGFHLTRRNLLRSAATAAPALAFSPFLTNVASAHQVTPLAASFDPWKDIKSFTGTRQNSYPIVLVHGLAGFGRDELYGYKYWGGFTDIQQDLDNRGYTAYTASIGPFSSNWDRACELYAQIKGGTVDYGLAHSTKYGHARYGRTYPGLYPQWGEINPTTGQINQIHLVGHSMGGQTSRTLTQLLEQGSPDEQATASQDQVSSLFQGGKQGWIKGVFTISSPHDGSTLTTLVENALPLASEMIGFLASVQGYDALVNYDFGLDQWGFVRQAGESLDDYINRISQSAFWKSTKDNAEWDLDPDGAAALNGWVRAQSDIYYFSISNVQTFKNIITGHQDPDLDMNPFLSPLALYMGSYTSHRAGHVVIDSKWWPNDGAANTISMAGPTFNTTDQIVAYTGTPQIGLWNSLGTIHDMGHLEIVGTGLTNMLPWYRGVAGFLASLPA